MWVSSRIRKLNPGFVSVRVDRDFVSLEEPETPRYFYA